MMETYSTRRSYRLLLFVYTFVIVLFGAALAGAAIFVFLPEGLGSGYGAVLSTVQGIRKDLLIKAVCIYGGMSIFLICAVALLHLFYSHRIAGPAYRLGREAASLGQGSLKGNIHFRRKDNLTDMADSLNQVAAEYRARVGAVKDRLSFIEIQEKSVAELLKQSGSATSLERAVREMTLNLKAIDRVLSEIRT